MSAIDVIYAALDVLGMPMLRSNGTIESKIIDVVATYADSEALERNNTMATIMTALANQKTTSVEYYRRKAALFQVGDTLKYDPVNQGGYYDPVNPQNQIIKQAYITGSSPIFTLLVNAVDSVGHLRKLTNTELASFRTYFAAFQPISLNINISSLDAAKIYATDTRIYVRSGTNAEAAILSINNALIAYESVLRAYNTVSVSEIVDVIQKTEGVLAVNLGGDVYATEVQLNGSSVTTRPVNGIFNLVNGAFTFSTPLTVANIYILENT